MTMGTEIMGLETGVGTMGTEIVGIGDWGCDYGNRDYGYWRQGLGLWEQRLHGYWRQGPDLRCS